MDEIKVRLIEYGSEDYKAELEMRNEILRKPLGLSIYDEDLGQEKPYFHIGAFENERLVGNPAFHRQGRRGLPDAPGGRVRKHAPKGHRA